MKRYVAVDSGKFATKVASYDPEKDKASMFKFKTKISPGNFKDDALENQTMIMEYDGQVYKIGSGALRVADLETSKTSEIHKLSVLTALAMLASSKEVDEFYVGLGMPVQEWENVDKREAYKNYILPEGEISVTVMANTSGKVSKPVTKKFVVKSRYAYPESKGAIYIDEMASHADEEVGVIDIGNLNINCTRWIKNVDTRDLDHAASFTDELGGSILIQGLAQELSSAFSRCDETLVSKILREPRETRFLKPIRSNPQIEEESKKLIDEYLLSHVKQIRNACNTKRWSLDFMPLIFIGGTAELLKHEIKEVFGDQVFIPGRTEYANVLGFLRIVCAKELNKVIQLP